MYYKEKIPEEYIYFLVGGKTYRDRLHSFLVMAGEK